MIKVRVVEQEVPDLFAEVGLQVVAVLAGVSASAKALSCLQADAAKGLSLIHI